MFPDYYKKPIAPGQQQEIHNSPWVWTSGQPSYENSRLLCLPYAGGGAGVFVPFAKPLAGATELWAIRPPGRESRWKEPSAASIREMVLELADEIAPHLHEKPYAILGYSLGSLLAFEFIRELRRRRAALPRLFFAAGRGAPQMALKRSPLHTLPDREFLEALAQRYQGIPKIVLEDPELLRLYLPPLRADMRLNETYQYQKGLPLEIPVVALGGLDDPSVEVGDLAAWRVQTSASFLLEMMPGGHFFLQEQRAQFLAAIRRHLMAL